jgi:MFS transporter, FHS family, glucose/mannose:H+ symporter
MQQSSAIFKPLISRQATAATYAGFIVTGVVTTMLGPLLPTLQAKWALNDAQAGYLFTAQFATSIIGTAMLGAVLKRFGLFRSLAASYALMAAGVAGVGAASFYAGIFAVGCYGFALGIALPATNILIAEMNPEQRAAKLNILNFIWCAGAVACPATIAIFINSGRTFAPLAIIALMLAAISAFLLRFGSPGLTSAQRKEMRSQKSAPRAKAFSIVWRSSFAYVIAALIFLYVGAENGIAGWIASYTRRTYPSMQAFESLPQSIFWAAVLVGRLSAPVALAHLSEERLALAALFLSLLGISLLIASTQMAGLLAGAALAGAGFAPVYPTTLAIFMKYYGERAAASVAPIFAMGGLGGATVPWVVGFVSKQMDSLRAGLMAPLAINVALIALAVVVMLRSGKAGPAAGAKSEAVASR